MKTKEIVIKFSLDEDFLEYLPSDLEKLLRHECIMKIAKLIFNSAETRTTKEK